ncbi:hypothetical protein [Inquilinus sp.]|uniref:hypothetical protein n=1 Tax=Inquilinus sp. TaxID=1932117 RepID=UPI00378515E3
MDEEAAAGRALTAQIFGTITTQRFMIELLLMRYFLDFPDPIATCDETEDALLTSRPTGDPGADPDMAYAILQASEAEIERTMSAVRSRLRARLDLPE